MTTSSRSAKLNTRQDAVLRLLYEYKHLDTAAIHAALEPETSYNAFDLSLTRMEHAGLILRQRNPPQPTINGISSKGAEAIGLEAKSQHYRLPSPATLEARQIRLRIETEAKRRGYIVYPQTPASPLSKVQALQSANRQIVVKHWKAREKAHIEYAEAHGEFVAPRWTQYNAGVNPVPLVFRECYMHQPGVTGFVVVYAGMKTDRRFWTARAEQLGRMSKILPVLCVFVRRPPADLLQQLKGVGFKVTLLENFSKALDEMK